MSDGLTFIKRFSLWAALSSVGAPLSSFVRRTKPDPASWEGLKVISQSEWRASHKVVACRIEDRLNPSSRLGPKRKTPDGRIASQVRRCTCAVHGNILEKLVDLVVDPHSGSEQKVRGHVPADRQRTESRHEVGQQTQRSANTLATIRSGVKRIGSSSGVWMDRYSKQDQSCLACPRGDAATIIHQRESL
jgi:hypothetical protein